MCHFHYMSQFFRIFFWSLAAALPSFSRCALHVIEGTSIEQKCSIAIGLGRSFIICI